MVRLLWARTMWCILEEKDIIFLLCRRSFSFFKKSGEGMRDIAVMIKRRIGLHPYRVDKRKNILGLF